MSASVPWTIALVTAAATAILAIIDIRASRRSKPISLIARLTHLLAGGLIGYLSIAFFPALPLLAAIGGMLATRAIQSSRWADAGLMAVGFGTTWTALMGWGIVNDRLDPAVHGGDQTVPFLLGASVLVGGLLLLMSLTLWPERFSGSR